MESGVAVIRLHLPDPHHGDSKPLPAHHRRRIGRTAAGLDWIRRERQQADRHGRSAKAHDRHPLIPPRSAPRRPPCLRPACPARSAILPSLRAPASATDRIRPIRRGAIDMKGDKRRRFKRCRRVPLVIPWCGAG